MAELGRREAVEGMMVAGTHRDIQSHGALRGGTGGYAGKHAEAGMTRRKGWGAVSRGG
jgi:hypothetical protein